MHTKINLSEDITHALSIMGYDELLPIQKKVIPYIMAEKDVVVKAKTGSGKTAAFAIPLCEKVDWQIKEPQVLVLACTRELAMQIQSEFASIGRFKKMKVTCIIGKENMDYQKDALKQKCHVVVGTPGRLYDHIEQDSIDLSKVKYVVIDEADYMLDMGFCEQVEQILEVLPKQRVTALFSATYPKQVNMLIDHYTNNAKWIENVEDSTIDHYYVKGTHKWKTLLQLLSECQVESGIVFCNEQVEVDKIHRAFSTNGIQTLKIHGGMLQKQRIQSMEAFKKGESRLLIASDVVARGIDIEKVSHVFHYDAPKSIKEYTHRCGRSGRVNQKGCSILLLENEDEILTKLQNSFTIQAYPLASLDKSSLHLTYLNKNVKKEDKQKKWLKDVCKLYFSVGKSKKIRTVDLLGALCSIEGVEQEDIGVIHILNHMSYVEILNGKEQIILSAFQDKTIKNKKVKVEIAKE
ncbi:MAG: DEAD/DEAH box helicase [Erysipelotrichia bacterium]|nr:DEAD/DEAH box helicase [Erysipelotrichia bacterium]NCC54358.1 DEAD/DEAH box helicase [Erysipelotrichia bacterium]